jgi:hypothetical protein
MKFIRIFLLILIIIGIALLFSQKIWVPRLVDKILSMENTSSPLSEIKNFTDSNNVFTLNYNSSFTNTEGAQVPTTDWSLNAKELGIVLAKINIPRGYKPNTNFSDAFLTIGRSTEPSAIKNCLNKTLESDKDEGFVTIGGFQFKKFTFSEGAAGNFYDSTSYRGIVDGDCYAVEYTIHSTNIGNYSGDQGITEFNKSEIQNEFEKTIQSLKFLISSD